MASRREPMWYCHECHAEMRPLMVPDPHCASCNGTFVEKIEGETDDPREFQASGPAIDVDDAGADLGFESFLTNLTRLMGQGAREQQAANTGASSVPPNRERSNAGVRLEFSRGSSGGTRTWVLGGSPTLGGTRRPSGASGPSGGDSPAIAGPLMAQYLLSMLSQRSQRDGREDPFGGFNMFGRTGGPEDGRWGDYVFNQEALDQIITQMMENSNSHGPVPATDEVMQKLDRQVLEENSPTLERDCAVCKEQFSLHTEDPDEQVVVTLPCKHPFHEGCIIPWLKSSGTCPVCRHQLVPQPEHHAPRAAPTPGPSSAPSGGSNTLPSFAGTAADPGGPTAALPNLFNYLNRLGSRETRDNGNGNPPPPPPPQSRPPNSRNSSHGRSQSDGEPPGGWWD